MEQTKCLIIGSGPAGFTAAIYASRANLAPIVYEGIEPGGQLTTTTDIENFPGYPEGIKGTEMMADLKRQAQRFGADVRFGVVTNVDFDSRPFVVTIDKAPTLVVLDGNQPLAHLSNRDVSVKHRWSVVWRGLYVTKHIVFLHLD